MQAVQSVRHQKSPRRRRLGISGDQPVSPGVVSDTIHPHHDGCCLTPSFAQVVSDASVPVLVVDQEGFVVYVNPQLENLMEYSSGELPGKHITDIVDAAPRWVASEFAYLADNRLWNGNVLLRRFHGETLRVSVNAFRSVLPGSCPEYIALLHGVGGEGPAICRIPDKRPSYGLAPEEIALLELLSEGFIEKEIAAILGSSVWHVSRELQSLLQKLNVSSRTEAGVRALREGLLA